MIGDDSWNWIGYSALVERGSWWKMNAHAFEEPPSISDEMTLSKSMTK